MPVYRCDICNHETKIKKNHFRHLNTKKHINNEKNYGHKLQNESKLTHFDSLNTFFESKMNPNESIFPKKMTHFESKMNHFESSEKKDKKVENSINSAKNLKKYNKIYECEFCSKEYSSSSNLRRHQKICKEKKNDNSLIEMIKHMEKMHKEQIDKIEVENEGLKKTIETLINKVGNTTNNTTNITQNNNIVLNCYGNEDISYITDLFKTCLLKIPYTMIPKLIEEIHFNKKYPENQNIILPNKKEPYVKVYSDQKWIYKDRKETVKNLIDKNYCIIDTFFEDSGKNKLESKYILRYGDFQKKKDDDNKELDKKLRHEVDMLLMNTSNS